jgi:hypothetical protein
LLKNLYKKKNPNKSPLKKIYFSPVSPVNDYWTGPSARALYFTRILGSDHSFWGWVKNITSVATTKSMHKLTKNGGKFSSYKKRTRVRVGCKVLYEEVLSNIFFI